MVVHSGPLEELERLLEVALERKPRDVEVVLVTPFEIPRLPGLFFLSCYPAWFLCNGVTGVVSGAGYNALAHFVKSGRPFLAVPFSRKYDQQHERLGVSAFFAGSGNQQLAALILSMLQ